MKKTTWALFFVCLLILFGGTIASLATPEREYSVRENRELAGKPKFTEKKFFKGKFQKKYETYLSDQFFLRDRWVNLSGAIQAAEGKKEINGVYLGRDGYLVEKSLMDDTLTGDSLTENSAMEKSPADGDEEKSDQRQVQENVEYLSSFLNDMTKEYGEDHVSCLLIPSKAAAMPEKLPAFAEVSDYSGLTDALGKKLQNPEILMDLRDVMNAHQGEYIYYRTDHHWTTLGAYYAYQAWAERTGQAEARPLDSYERETVFDDFYGTTYNKAHVRVPADDVELFHSPGEEGVTVRMDDGETEANSLYFYDEAKKGFNRYNIFFSKNTFKIEIRTGAKTGKSLLVLKDSFANCFVPFLTEDYEQIVMIDYRYGKTAMGNILEQYDAITDVLVLFNTEKFMQNTKLAPLADTEKRESSLQEFDPTEFLNMDS